jgi:hypothetical protein
MHCSVEREVCLLTSDRVRALGYCVWMHSITGIDSLYRMARCKRVHLHCWPGYGS